MNLKRWLTAAAVATSAALTAAPAAAQPTELHFWMGLTGANGEMLMRFGEEFNRAQTDFRVVVSFKGQYPEQRAAAVAPTALATRRTSCRCSTPARAT